MPFDKEPDKKEECLTACWEQLKWFIEVKNCPAIARHRKWQKVAPIQTHTFRLTLEAWELLVGKLQGWVSKPDISSVLFGQHLRSTDCGSGTVLDTGDVKMSKIQTF